VAGLLDNTHQHMDHFLGWVELLLLIAQGTTRAVSWCTGWCVNSTQSVTGNIY